MRDAVSTPSTHSLALFEREGKVCLPEPPAARRREYPITIKRRASFELLVHRLFFRARPRFIACSRYFALVSHSVSPSSTLFPLSDIRVFRHGQPFLGTSLGRETLQLVRVSIQYDQATSHTARGRGGVDDRPLSSDDLVPSFPQFGYLGGGIGVPFKGLVAAVDAICPSRFDHRNRHRSGRMCWPCAEEIQ